MQATQEQIRDANLALHAATSRLLADAEELRKRREEFLRLVSVGANEDDDELGAAQ
jgi:hypothetical protein